MLKCFSLTAFSIRILLLLSICTPSYATALLPGNIQSPDIESIRKEGTLKVAILKISQPPFFLRNAQNELVGIDINLAKELAKELGVKVTFIEADTFDGVAEKVFNKEVHVGISKLSVTTKRAQKIRFAGQYVNLSKALLVNRLEFKKFKNQGANTIRDVFKLPEATIGVIANSSYETFARDIFPAATIKTYKTWDELVDEVLNGKITAAFRDEWEVRKALDKKPDLPIYAEAIFLKNQNDPIKVAVAWDSFLLAEFIDSFILLNDKYIHDVPSLLEANKTYEIENATKKITGKNP